MYVSIWYEWCRHLVTNIINITNKLVWIRLQYKRLNIRVL